MAANFFNNKARAAAAAASGNSKSKPTDHKEDQSRLQPWVEKYRPKSLDDVAAQDHAVTVLQRTLQASNLPHMLFYGPPGTGKTSTILALAKSLFGPALYRTRILELNASDERGINIVREKIKDFARTQLSQATGIDASYHARYPCPPFKIIILDEADSMTQDAQSALRRTMEQYSRITRFCLVCNYVTRIIEPLASRCSKFRFKALEGVAAGERLQEIATAENLKLESGVIDTLIKCSEGDLRRAITYMQSAARLVGASRPSNNDEDGDMEMADADGSDLITSRTVEEIAGVVPEKIIDRLTKAIQPKKIGSAYEAVSAAVTDIVADGWSATQILSQLYRRVVYNDAIPDTQKNKIVMVFSEIDKRDAEYVADISEVPEHSHSDRRDVAFSDERQAGNAHLDLRRKAQRAVKIAYIDRLLRDLDIVTYCELLSPLLTTNTNPPNVSILADWPCFSCNNSCSIVLFATRAIVQLIFFTPKAPPFDPTRNQPFIGAIFSSNLFCMLLHLLFVHPDAGEETRGYLHGGLFIDFIGQKAPASKVRLLAFDALVMILHLIMLGLVLERVKTTGSPNSSPTSRTGTASAIMQMQETHISQDYDSEERGVLRSDHHDSRVRAALHLSASAAGDGDIELDDLSLTRNRENTGNNPEREWRTEQLLAEPSDDGTGQSAHKDGHALDVFVSGQAVIMDMNIVNTIRDQWRYHGSVVSARSPSHQPSRETATFLRERLGLQVGPDGRVGRVER
ncbi:hypothetical protein V8E54_007906 [Elaphomyces granulatus]